MRKKIWMIICLLIIIMMPTFTAKAANDTNKNIKKEASVKVSSVKFNKKTFKSGDVLKYEVKISPIKDVMKAQMKYYDCNRVESIDVEWVSSKQQTIVRSYKWDGKSQITINDKIGILKGMQSGKWILGSVGINYAGEKDSYGIEVYSDKNKYAEKSDIKVKFPDSEFVVKGTKADNNAPSIDLSSVKISSRIIDTKKSSVFSIKINDESKVKKVATYWTVFDKDATFAKKVTINMHYNKKTKRYECKVKLGRNQTMKKLDSVVAVDVYGNKTFKDYDAYSKSKAMAKMNKMKVALKSGYFAKNMKNADKWSIVYKSSVTKEIYTKLDEMYEDGITYNGNYDDIEAGKEYLNYVIQYDDNKPKDIEIYRSTKKNSGFKKIATTSLYGEGDDDYKDFDVTPGKTYYYKSRIVSKVENKKIYSNFSPVVSCIYE